MRINKTKFRHIFLAIISFMLLCTAVFCVIVRIYETQTVLPLDILAAELTMPTGNAEYSEPSEETSVQSSNNPDESTAENSTDTSKKESSDTTKKEQSDFQESNPSEKEIKKYEKSHEGEEKYPIKEMTVTKGNQSYKNVQIKNLSSADIDIKSELESKLGFTIEDTDKPQVLIYHTHTCESFMMYDTGYFYESFYPRTSDNSKNVCAVGDEIAKQLNNAGIVTIHDTTQHDNPSYSGAYDRSLETINSYLKKYPSIKVVLDIHRDGIGTDTEKTKPVFTVNGKKAAQIMILSGYNYDDSDEFKDWEYNLRFALQIQNTAEKMYPDMVRPLYFADFMYNMNVNTGSLLIEVGSDSNTLEEVRYSGYLLGNVLAEVLKNNMQ
ncbi:MAG: stage II sporulation protein P [Acutalibacteraceae bacterium]